MSSNRVNGLLTTAHLHTSRRSQFARGGDYGRRRVRRPSWHSPGSGTCRSKAQLASTSSVAEQTGQSTQTLPSAATVCQLQGDGAVPPLQMAGRTLFVVPVPLTRARNAPLGVRAEGGGACRRTTTVLARAFD